MKNELRPGLDDLRSRGLYRELKTVTSAQGRTILINGQELLSFSSNDYLGLAADARLAQAATEALTHYGVGSGASRLVCGTMEPHTALEQEIARMKKAERALLFSSGYMANVGIIPALVGRGDVVFADRLNHASIIDGIILSRAEMKRYAHCDMNVLEQLLAATDGARRKLIVTDSVFSMDGDRAPLEAIVELAKKYGAWTMVDEAHAFGVLGPSGGGLIEELGLADQVDIQMGTLSKAAGSFGSYVAGTEVLIEHLINHARSFIFTTAMPPAVAAASRAALEIIRCEPERRERVLKNAERLREGLKKSGFDTMQSSTPIIPVLIGDEAAALRISRHLMEEGVYAQAIRPPTVPKGTARLRVTVTAAHRDEDIEHCLAAFQRSVQ